MTIWQTQADVPSHDAPPEVRQARPAQHEPLPVHAWPLDEQVAPGWQEPVAEPSGTSQRRPEQQSEPEVHAPFWGWHAAGASHLPDEQMLEQHCDPEVQMVPLAWHVPPVPASGGVPPSVGGEVSRTWHARVSSEVARHSVPAQHVTPPVSQGVPTGAHVGFWQDSRPVPSPAGRHRAPSQHCSENWQVLLCAMQQGASPV
jgi:hypothetical protein